MSEPNARASWKENLSTTVKACSLVYLAFALPALIWFGLSLQKPLTLDLLLDLAFISGPGLLIANLVLAVFAKGHRLVHIAITLLLVSAFAVAQVTRDSHVDKRHRWFVHEESKTYEEMVAKILQHRSELEAQPRSLRGIVQREAFGQTNAEGALTILFPGGEGGPRHGYLYYSGSLLATDPVHVDEPITHLTNHWYEY